MNKTNNPHKNRRNMTRIMILLTGIVFSIFFIRFSTIMLTKTVKGENLSEHVENLYTRSSILPAKRGTIYDKGGNPVALDATSYSMVGVLTDKWSDDKDKPFHVVDKEKTAKALAKHISLSESEILKILSKEDADQVEFGSAGMNLSYSVKANIEAEELTGIIFNETPTRLYPNGVFASHLVGYAAVDKEKEASEQTLEGLMGIEQAFNERLKGKDGKSILQEDSQGYMIPGTEQRVSEPTDGSDVYLTLDMRLQSYLETLMTTVYEEAKPESMVAMLVNPKNGHVLAATQRPTFNATTLEGIDQKWQNLLVEESFEPGSTFKILTVAAAINEGVFQPNMVYQSGSVAVDGGIIRDFNEVGWGTISYLEGFARSSNVLVVKLIEAMGYDVWESYMKSFGIGESTNSGLLNEATGNYNFNYELEQANTAFGQGVTITPFQLVQAFTAIANGGKMMKLQYIDKTVDPVTEEEQTVEPTELASPITEQTATLMLDYLTHVVYEEYGTASAYAIDNAKVGAKTGTAELVNPDTGMYYTGLNQYLFSVVGFAPIEDPEYIFYVTLKLPSNNDQKNFVQYLSSVFNPMMTRAVAYANHEETSLEGIEVAVPSVIQSTKEEAIQTFEEQGFSSVSVIGTGSTVVQQYPYESTKALSTQKVLILTEGAMTMPDIRGWSKGDVLKIAELTGVSFTFEGEGYVTYQELPEGSVLDPKKPVKIILE